MKSKAHLFGHSLHQILIAFPVALLSTSVLFDVLWRITGDAKWPPMAFYLIELGIIGGLLAALFGFIDYLAIPGGVRAKRTGALHGFASVIVVAIFAGSWVSRLGHIASPPPHALFFSFCGVALLGAAGWLGGELVTRFAVGVVDGAHLDARDPEEELRLASGEPALASQAPAPAPLSSSLAEQRSK